MDGKCDEGSGESRNSKLFLRKYVVISVSCANVAEEIKRNYVVIPHIPFSLQIHLL